jgi:hypothetical protein
MSKNVTIVTIETMFHELGTKALEKTLEHFDPKEVVVFSNKELLPGSRTVHTEPIPTFRQYNELMLKGMLEHINTDHLMFVQWDAMAYDGSKWTDEFLEYDYIGAVWPWQPEGLNVGNGGFSLRSRKLLEALQDERIQLTAARNFIAEDVVFGVDHRAMLEEEYGIKYAPTALAQQFSHEIEEGQFHYKPGFAFHGQWNVVKLADLDTVDLYIQKMEYKGWNIYKWHHFLKEVAIRKLYDYIPFLMTQLTSNSPELVDPLLQWLALESEFWAKANSA